MPLTAEPRCRGPHPAEGQVTWHSSGRVDGLVGTGATGAERALGYGSAAVLTLLIVGADLARAEPVAQAGWQVPLLALFAFDIAGGAVANMLNSCKRLYHSPPRPEDGAVLRALKNPRLFTALHVHPVPTEGEGAPGKQSSGLFSAPNGRRRRCIVFCSCGASVFCASAAAICSRLRAVAHRVEMQPDAAQQNGDLRALHQDASLITRDCRPYARSVMSYRDRGRGDLVRSASGAQGTSAAQFGAPDPDINTGRHDLEKVHDPDKNRKTGLTKNRDQSADRQSAHLPRLTLFGVGLPAPSP